MTGPGAAGRRSVAWRLAAISLAGAAVTGALYAAGRLHTPNYTFSLFGQTGLAAVTLKSLLASLVLGLAAPHVPLALWIYRKPPLAGSPPRPVRPAHRITGFALFALFATMPKQLPGLKTNWTVLPQVEAMVLARPPSLCVKPLQIANPRRACTGVP